MPNTSVAIKNADVHWQRNKLSIGTNSEGHSLVLDVPVSRGGNGWGFRGGDLLLLGVGACFMTVFLEAGERRGISIEDVHVQVSAREKRAPSRYDDLQIRVQVHSSASDEDLLKLLKIAERGCQVSNTLTEGATVSSLLDRAHVPICSTNDQKD